MKGTIEVINIKGIPIRFHWSFLLLLSYILFYGLYEDLRATAIFLNALFILAVFCCIVLHELGHAFAAAFFNIPTVEVLILPIGGVAYIDKSKMSGFQEFLIAFCGPLINLLLALGIWIFLCIYSPVEVTFVSLREQLSNVGISFSIRLMWINYFIFWFNLIPTLPMDGGVMLRAILSVFFTNSKTTKIQFVITILFSIGFLIYSWYYRAVEYLFFAWFLYFSARMRNFTRLGY